MEKIIYSLLSHIEVIIRGLKQPATTLVELEGIKIKST